MVQRFISLCGWMSRSAKRNPRQPARLNNLVWNPIKPIGNPFGIQFPLESQFFLLFRPSEISPPRSIWPLIGNPATETVLGVFLKTAFIILLSTALFAADQQTLLAIQDAITTGNLEAASKRLQTNLQAHPNDAGLLNLRGVVHAERGEVGAAQDDFARAVALAPDLMPAWQNLGRACQMDASNTCAEHAWKRVLRWHPTDVEAHKGLAVALQRSGNYADSLQAMAGVPEDTAQLMVQCLDYSGLHQLEKADAAARNLAQHSDFAEGDLEAMNAAAPSARVILGEALDARGELKLGGLKQLAMAYETANRLSDERKTLERIAAAEPQNTADLLELARIAEKQNDHTGALGYVGHARDLTPQDPQVHFLFGMVAAEMELPMEARRSFDKALQLAPANPDYNYAMGAVILTTRDAATAARYFQKFVDARPDDAKGHYALGLAEFTSGDYASASKQLQSVENNASFGGGAEFFLGRMARLDGDLEAAARYQAKAIAKLPRFAEPHTEMARVRMLEGKLDDAGAELKRALALNPQSFQANEQLLVLYKKTHDERASGQAEMVKKLDEERSKREDLMLRGVEIRPTL
jgi:Flp pilus assembly protein TadD